MNIRMDRLVKAIAQALDFVEAELLGASTHHGKRISVLSTAMGKYFGMDEENLQALSVCALMHDNALTEYILAERQGRPHDPAMKLHCEYGQKNIEAFGLKPQKGYALNNSDVNGYILYHHECADGSGPYQKKKGEFPLGAEIIAIADALDVRHHLQRVSPSELSAIRKNIANRTGTWFTERAAEAMLCVLDEEMLLSLHDDSIIATSEKYIQPWFVDIEDDILFRLAKLVPHIIDYKSVFTQKHSTGITEKAWLMSGIYGYDSLQRAQLYLAAAFHDIGKLSTPVSILEKPGPLNHEEFTVIKQHVRLTWELLKDIDGFENICAWASNHHEKLDGSGYSFGRKDADLDFNSRLLACVDIYQALTEERPYHAGKDHKTVIAMLSDMGRRGLLDMRIIKDLDEALCPAVCRTAT
jgi:HD-GYP domain-containing protein (c-di-GMP phosphodiesterase class II)